MPFDMFREIVEKWIDVFKKRGQPVPLGGGEPTLHPKFWKMISFAHSLGLTPWLATNGSDKETTLMLCELAKKGLVGVALSIDKWHDPIDEEVVETFRDGLTRINRHYYEYWTNKNGEDCTDCNRDLREIRTTLIPYKGGRANNLPEAVELCPCAGIKFEPTGEMIACGCEGSPQIGDYKKGITAGNEWKYYDIVMGCYKRKNEVNGNGKSK